MIRVCDKCGEKYASTMDFCPKDGHKLSEVDTDPADRLLGKSIDGRFLITEKIRGAGGQPLNKDGELFVFPREPRDVESSAFIRECENGNGVETYTKRAGIWLDSPLIDQIHGEGYTAKQFPAMHRQFIQYGIDMIKDPLLVFPSLHYQNGGIEINEKCETDIPGLFVAGEASGGVHGRNRLMGNSVLDYNVFGRRAGRFASEYVKTMKPGKPTLEHVTDNERNLEEAGIFTDIITPVILPSYTPEDVKLRRLARSGSALARHAMLKSRIRPDGSEASK